MSDQSDALNKLARERGIISDPPAPLPYVLLPRQGVQLVNFAEAVAGIVGVNGLYRRETTPVTINRENGRIESMDPQRFRSYVETQLVPYFEPRPGWKMPATMTSSEAIGCLSSDAFIYPLRRLQRVHHVRQPIMRVDGRIELLPKGYDDESQILTMKDCLDYPTDWDLQRAKFFFDHFLSEVPFTNPRSKAVHIAATIAVYGASLLPEFAKRLNFAYRANRARSGKGLFLQSAIVGPCGPFVQIQAISDSKEEFRKILDTEALNSSPYIVFDEVENGLKNCTLNAFITASVWTGRLMHSQKKFAVPQSSILFIAGNNIDLSSDLTGRFLLVDLYVAEADAQSRVIKHVIDEVYLSRDDVRAELLAASWGMVNAWNQGIGIDEHGNGVKRDPRPAPLSVYRGFETFSNIIGGIVQNAGFGNPLESTAAEVDSDYGDMLAIVEHLVQERLAQTRRGEFDFEELIDVCRKLHCFEWHLVSNGSRDRFELTAAKKSWFGKLFSSQYAGAIFRLADGRRAEFGRKGRNRQRVYTIEVI